MAVLAALLVLVTGVQRVLVVCQHGQAAGHLELAHAPGGCDHEHGGHAGDRERAPAGEPDGCQDEALPDFLGTAPQPAPQPPSPVLVASLWFLPELPAGSAGARAAPRAPPPRPPDRLALRQSVLLLL